MVDTESDNKANPMICTTFIRSFFACEVNTSYSRNFTKVILRKLGVPLPMVPTERRCLPLHLGITLLGKITYKVIAFNDCFLPQTNLKIAVHVRGADFAFSPRAIAIYFTSERTATGKMSETLVPFY